MTETTVNLQPAYIIQHRKFRETSLILDVLTRDFGRISLLAKSVRTAKSKTVGLLQPFIPLVISYFGKADLKTLTAVELKSPFNILNGTAIYSGFYINELIGIFLHKDDPHPEVFNHYGECVSALSDQSKLQAALRNFELDLITNAGYGLQFEYDFKNNLAVAALKKYHFDVEQGPIEATDGFYSGKALQAMSRRDFSEPQVLFEAKCLMRNVIDVYLKGKQLKSRIVINKIIQQSKHA
jgi:DNA repair protein RecO (recombination protein O)